MPVSVELLARLLEDNSATLELYARQWSHSPADVVQEAFVRLAGQSAVPGSPVAWLFAVVRNLAISDRRASVRRFRHESAAANGEPWFEVDPAGPLDASSATAALGRLPDETREIVIAHVWGGLSFGEIGELIGRSSSTAHRRYVEGIEELRKHLGVSCPK